MLAKIDARSTRAERAQAKVEQELLNAQKTLQQTNIELEQITRLAEIFYETSQKMGSVVDQLMRSKEHKKNEEEPESMRAMLDVALEERELENSGEADGTGTCLGAAKGEPKGSRLRSNAEGKEEIKVDDFSASNCTTPSSRLSLKPSLKLSLKLIFGTQC